jgi:hypothetical protein
MNWQNVSGLVAHARREDRHLLVYVSRGADVGPWIVSAFETPHGPDASRSPVDGLRAALGDHAHVTLDPVTSLPEALALGERYAKWWRSSRAQHFNCGCGEIEQAAP